MFAKNIDNLSLDLYNSNTGENTQSKPEEECGSKGYLYDNWNNYYIEPNQLLTFFGCNVGEKNTQEYHDKNYEDIYWNLKGFNMKGILDECTEHYSLECMAGGGINPVYDVATGQIVGYASHVTISHTNAISGRATVYVGNGYVGKDNFYWIEKLY